MLDPAILKDNLEVFESNISKRNLEIDVNHLISLNQFAENEILLNVKLYYSNILYKISRIKMGPRKCQFHILYIIYSI